MILQGQLGIRIKAEKGANADGLIAQVGEFGISVAIVIVARVIAVLSVDVESRFVVFRYQGGIQRRVVLERTASTNRHQRMGKLGGVTGGFLGNDIDGSPDGGCAEQGRSTSAHHLYTFYHVSRDLFQAVHTCQC